MDVTSCVIVLRAHGLDL